MRDYVENEHYRQVAGNAIRLSRPDIQFKYAPKLVFRAMLIWEQSGFAGSPPEPEDVAKIDDDWLIDIHTMIDLTKFHRDYWRRPGMMLQ